MVYALTYSDHEHDRKERPGYPAMVITLLQFAVVVELGGLREG
jgi:hypothetical protein